VQDVGGKDTRGGIYWCDNRSESFLNFWLSSLYSCTCREEDQVGALQQEGFVCGLHLKFKVLQGLHYGFEEDSRKKRLLALNQVLEKLGRV
jgi:hypothetical protein